MEAPVVVVGNKPASAYTLEIMTHLAKKVKAVKVKARGSSISKAAQVCEIVKRLTGGKIRYTDIQLYSEEVGEPGEEKTIPVMEIMMMYMEE